jgi:hypothetical protein
MIARKDLHLFPYSLTSVQELHPADFPQRLEYCQWFVNTLDVHLDRTFFTNEAYFHLSGYVNSQNTRMWSSENPHFFIETPQYSWKVGVWATISQHRIIRPIFFEDVALKRHQTSTNLERTQIVPPPRQRRQHKGGKRQDLASRSLAAKTRLVQHRSKTAS